MTNAAAGRNRSGGRGPGKRTRAFYSLHNGKPAALSTDSVAAVLTHAATAAHQKCPSTPKNIHCHMLTKTKAMDPYQQGIPLPVIMRLLGHKNMSTTAAFRQPPPAKVRTRLLA